MTNIIENNVIETEEIQSHWGSGVKLTVVSLTKKPAPVPPSAILTAKKSSVWALLFGLAVALFCFACLRAGTDAKPSSDEVKTALSKDGKIMYGDKHVIETRVLREVSMAAHAKYPSVRFVYEPSWVNVFGNVTKGRNYDRVYIYGQYEESDSIGHFNSSISNHLFDKSTFRRAEIRYYDFINCSFKECDFSEAVFYSSNMSGSDFTGAFLGGTEFRWDDHNRFPCDLSKVKGLTLKQFKLTKNYQSRKYDDDSSTNFVTLPPDIQKALDEEKKAQDAKKEK